MAGNNWLQTMGIMNTPQDLTAAAIAKMGQSPTGIQGVDFMEGYSPQTDFSKLDPSTVVGSQGAGLNMGGLQTWAGMLGSLGNMWGAFQGNKLASQALDFQKESYQTNLGNQKKTYNTALEDRIRSRSVAEGRAAGYADDYINKNKL